MEKVSTEEEREGLRAEFEVAEEWLYEEGMDLVASAYYSRKRELEKSTGPVFLRLRELEARPRVVEQANEAINWTLTILETWAAERPEVTDEERAIMVMSYACGLSHREIGESMTMPVGTVKSVIFRGKEKIRTSFDIKDHQHG